jgi:thiamine pyrophosphate-dependent acetolactate synthase large subunit-like protein
MMKKTLHRRDVVAQLLKDRGELLLISGLSAVFDITSAGDHELNFPMWGAMGGGAMMGLGLALAQPKRKTLVVTGDGEMLMGIGALATIAVMKPKNLYVVVLDNEHYAETGMQETHTGHGVDLAGMAKAAGFKHALNIDDQAGVARLRDLIYKGGGPLFAQVKIVPEKLPMVLPPRDGSFIKNRFRIALLGPSAIYDE